MESVIPINNVQLYYFFSNSPSGVNRLLKDKDVMYSLIFQKARIDLYFDNEKNPSASTILTLRDFCSPLVTYKHYYFNCIGTKAKCFIRLAIGYLKSEKVINASKMELKEIKEGYPIYVTSKSYYTCEPLPNEWLDLMPDINEDIIK